MLLEMLDNGETAVLFGRRSSRVAQRQQLQQQITLDDECDSSSSGDEDRKKIRSRRSITSRRAPQTKDRSYISIDSSEEAVVDLVSPNSKKSDKHANSFFLSKVIFAFYY